MEKTLPEKLALIKANVPRAYKAMQDGNAHAMADIAATLAMQQYSISPDIATLGFESESLEAEYKHKVAYSFIQEKEGGQTDKLAESRAKLKWVEMYTRYLETKRAFNIARAAHKDIENLLDVLRTNISIKKQEMKNL